VPHLSPSRRVPTQVSYQRKVENQWGLSAMTLISMKMHYALVQHHIRARLSAHGCMRKCAPMTRFSTRPVCVLDILATPSIMTLFTQRRCRGSTPCLLSCSFLAYTYYTRLLTICRLHLRLQVNAHGVTRTPGGRIYSPLAMFVACPCCLACLFCVCVV